MTQWISIQEQLPNSMEGILLHIKAGGNHNYNFISTGIMYPNNTFSWHKNAMVYKTAEVTHWMPLPDKPEVTGR